MHGFLSLKQEQVSAILILMSSEIPGKERILSIMPRHAVSVSAMRSTVPSFMRNVWDLPALCDQLKESKVTIYADTQAYQALEGYYPAELLQPATPESFGTEFLDYKMAVKTVKSFEDALGHIQENSSRHSECIVTENKERATLFTKIVDAACVYTNVSTAFTDGAQFGLGAEIGISTQKLHARGPMGLEEITSYKWVIEGDGQTRW